MYTIDTETCGFHGPIVLLQYAQDDGPVILHEVWREPIADTLALLERIAEEGIIGFNLSFDWFHICQLYTTLKLYKERHPYDLMPEIEKYAECESDARFLGCLKPKTACDVMLHIRKGPYQSTMDRKAIYIMKVPKDLGYHLCGLLNRLLPFRPLFFARRKKPAPIWQIQQHKKDQNFVNIYVKFAPSTALKPLCEDLFKVDLVRYSDIEVPPEYRPLELGYAPFAKAMQKLDVWKGQQKKKFCGPWKGAWPQFIQRHIDHWSSHPSARKYAGDDVELTRKVYNYYNFECGDDDSVLACMVGAIRWKGYAVDLKGIKELRDIAEKKLWMSNGEKDIFGNPIMILVPRAPTVVLPWLQQVMLPEEQLGLIDFGKDDSTDKEALDEMIKWDSPVSVRAKLTREARKAAKEIEMYDKLLIAERFHASFKVLGTLSSRMSGADKFNPQGIKKTKVVRSKFPLADSDRILCGGDFSGFEVTIADAVYDDPDLRTALQEMRPCHYCREPYLDLHSGEQKLDETGNKMWLRGAGCDKCEGTGLEETKIHGIFGTFIYPGKSYDDIIESDGKDPDYYTISKSGLFTWLFAGTEYSFQQRLGIPLEQGRAGILAFSKRYRRVGETRNQTMEDYSPVVKEKDSRISWRKHKTSVTTLFGFDRFFDLEFQVLSTLYKLASEPPEEWKQITKLVRRGDRTQTASGATQSAIYSACFRLQGRIARAAINTPIQGTGAQATKRVQAAICELQPAGYHEWIVQPANIHDELMCPTHPDYVDRVAEITANEVGIMKKVVPLMKLEWKIGLASWAEKKKSQILTNSNTK